MVYCFAWLSLKPLKFFEGNIVYTPNRNHYLVFSFFWPKFCKDFLQFVYMLSLAIGYSIVFLHKVGFEIIV